jgi:hypothetical protein
MEIEFEIVPSHAEEVMEASDFIPDLCEANAKKRLSRLPSSIRNAW